jgi:hypothetical protein
MTASETEKRVVNSTLDLAQMVAETRRMSMHILYELETGNESEIVITFDRDSAYRLALTLQQLAIVANRSKAS